MRLLTFILILLTSCSGDDAEDDDDEVGLVRPDIDTGDPDSDPESDSPSGGADSGDTTPPEDTAEPMESGEIALSDAELMFTAAGDIAITISNTGAGGLSIAEVGIQGEGKAAFAVGEPGASTLAPDSSTTVTVSFSPPDEVGGWRAELRVLSDDPDQESVTVALAGGVGEAQLGFGTEPLEIDDAIIGCERTESAVLHNTGGGVVEISALSLSGSSELTLGETESLPLSLLSGEQLAVEIIYQPQDDDDDDGYLLVATDDEPGTLTIAATAVPYDEGAELYELTEPTMIFKLSDTPVEATIEVRVGGIDQSGRFSYDSKSNAVVFAADSIPIAGEAVEIEYAIAGGC